MTTITALKVAKQTHIMQTRRGVEADVFVKQLLVRLLTIKQQQLN